MNQPEVSELKIHEHITLEKFEVEDEGRRLIETIRIEDGVIVERTSPALAQGG